MTDSALELGYRWQLLPARVELRPKAGWQEVLEEKAAAGKGERVSPAKRHTVMAYSFSEVRQVLPAVPGVYLIEAFHTDRYSAPDPGDHTKEEWSEIVDYHHEVDNDPTYEEARGQDPFWFYIGMSGNLRQRFAEHEQKKSALMRRLNDTVGAEDSSLRVSVQLGHWMKRSGDPAPVDLSSSLVRVLFEHAAIADYRWAHPDTPLVNIET